MSIREALKRVVEEFGTEHYCAVMVEASRHYDGQIEIIWSVYVGDLGWSRDERNLELAIEALKEQVKYNGDVGEDVYIEDTEGVEDV